MRRPVQEDLHQINDKIRAREVRLVGENVEPGVYPLSKALEIAREQELDLVVISDKAEPYISRILDYKKFLYEQKKLDSVHRPMITITSSRKSTLKNSWKKVLN